MSALTSRYIFTFHSLYGRQSRQSLHTVYSLQLRMMSLKQDKDRKHKKWISGRLTCDPCQCWDVCLFESQSRALGIILTSSSVSHCDGATATHNTFLVFCAEWLTLLQWSRRGILLLYSATKNSYLMENNLHLQFSSGRPSPLIRGPNSPDWSENWRWARNEI